MPEPAVLPVGAKAACIVGPAACPIADLSGNVEEWTGACDVNQANGDCIVRGGYFDSPATDLSCDHPKLYMRRQINVSLGFRCCVDPYEG